MVGILDDEGPDHDLRADIEHLRQDALPVGLVAPESSDRAGRAYARTGRPGHPREGNDHENDQHDDAQGYVRVADDRQVMDALLRLDGFGQRMENQLTGRVAVLVAEQIGQHHPRGYRHAGQGAQGVERLRQVEPPRGVLA